MIVVSFFKKIFKKKKIDIPDVEKIEQEEINPIYNLESKKTQDKIYDYYDYVDDAIERNKKTLN